MPAPSPTVAGTRSSSVRRLRNQPDASLHETQVTPTLIGESAVMKRLFSIIDRIAPTQSSVLITGATGTGKELVARTIHARSLRRESYFIGINCSAIPETLIEAELFGHERGIFTGADQNRCGLFELASGGTLLLDEIDALSLPAQAKLLRVLQERSVRRLGGRVRIPIDVRIISATNCDLSQAVAAGRFRPDLYYRLRVLPLAMPELCKREGDVELLVSYFLQRSAEGNATTPRRFTKEAMRALVSYPWPGNVRELENAVEYALALGCNEELGIEDLPLEIADSDGNQEAADLNELLQSYRNGSIPLAEIERRYILSVLRQFGGNQVQTAAALGIDRSKLYRRLKQYGVLAVKFLTQEQNEGMQLRVGRREGSSH